MTRRRVSIGRGQDHAPPAGDASGAGPGRADGNARGRTAPGRRIVRWLAFPALLLLLGYGGLAVALHLLLDPDDVAAWVEPRLAGVLNREVRVGGAAVALIPRPAVRLSDLVVESPDGFEGPPVAELREGQLDLAVLPLFLGRAHVHVVRLTGPTLHLAVDARGRSNFGDLVPERVVGGEAAAVGPLRLALRRITVSGGSLEYTDARDGRSLEITGIAVHGQAAGDGAGSWALEADLTSDSASYRREAGARGSSTRRFQTVGPEASLSVRGRSGADVIEIEEGRVALAGAILQLRGRVSGLLESSPALAVELRNDTLSASVLPRVLARGRPPADAPELGGELGVELHFEAPGVGDRGPTLRTRVTFRDVAVGRARTIVAEGLRGTVTSGDGLLQIDSITGTLAGGPFVLTASVSGPDRWLETRASARLDLSVLDRAGWAPPGTTLHGGLALDATVTGSLDLPEGIGATGTATLEGLRVDHERWDVPVSLPAGEIRLLPRGVAWDELSLMIGEDAVVTDGRLENLSVPGLAADGSPLLNATVRARRLLLDALLPPVAERVRTPYPRIAFAHLGDGRLDGRAAEELARLAGLRRPSAPGLRGRVDIAADTMRYGAYDLEGVAASVEMADRSIAVRDARFVAWGGQVTGALEVGTGPGPLEPFSLSLSTDGVDARSFLDRLGPFGESVTGTLDLDLALRGALDRQLLPAATDLAGSATVTVTEGRVSGSGPALALRDFLSSEAWSRIPFDRWESTWLIDRGALEARSSRMNGPLGEVRFAGPVGFDGRVDLEIALSIPARRLGEISLRRTGVSEAALDRLRASGAPLDLGIRMGGTLAHPTLEPDASVRVIEGPGG